MERQAGINSSLAFHLLVIVLLQGNPLTRLVTAAWFILFLVFSLTIFYTSTIGPVTDGIDYVMAHLYGGIWDDSMAVTSLLQRWSHVLLPVYVPWLTVWAVGLLGILFGAAVHERALARERVQAHGNSDWL